MFREINLETAGRDFCVSAVTLRAAIRLMSKLCTGRQNRQLIWLLCKIVVFCRSQMTAKRIEEITHYIDIPSDAGRIFGLSSLEPTYDESARFALALATPYFDWRLVLHYHEIGLPLPSKKLILQVPSFQ